MKRHFSRLALGTVLALALAAARAADDPDNPIGRFDIARFDVQGNTLLAASAVHELLAPFTGKNRDFGDVQRALEALEAAYHALGYNVVQVALPEQELNQGVVHFQVIETKIGKVTIEGNTVFDHANIRRSLPALQEGRTPNIGRISASLRMANENPAKKTALQLQSAERDDEVNALLKIDDGKPWKLGANFDNTGNSSTGTTHAGLLYQHANLSGRDDVLSLQYTTTLEKPSQVSVYGSGYHLPLYALGDSIDLFASYSNVDSGTVTAGTLELQVSGKGAVFGARYNRTVSRGKDYHAKLVAGLDYKAFENSVELSGSQLGNDVTVHPVSLAYMGTWTLAGGEANVSLTAVRNLPGGAHGGSADFNNARRGAPAGYTILRYSASLSHALPRDWQVRATAGGQYSKNSLIPGEQYGAGGAASVRGFAEREVSNDRGYGGSLELYTPNLCQGIERMPTQCRLLAFYDSARAARNDPLAGEQDHASIGSIGLGWRLALDKYLTLQLDYGHVLDAGGSQAKGDRHLHFTLGLSY